MSRKRDAAKVGCRFTAISAISAGGLACAPPPGMSSGTLKSRTEGFARRIVRLCLPLLEDARTHHVARHLLRSGTAANANYGSAHRGRTREEFAARLEQACDDITEAKEWIDLLWGVTATDELSALRAEAEDLEKLLAIACRTARAPGEEADAIGR